MFRGGQFRQVTGGWRDGKAGRAGGPFRLGPVASRASLYQRITLPLRWTLPDPDGPSWAVRWLLHLASLCPDSETVRP